MFEDLVGRTFGGEQRAIRCAGCCTRTLRE